MRARHGQHYARAHKRTLVSTRVVGCAQHRFVNASAELGGGLFGGLSGFCCMDCIRADGGGWAVGAIREPTTIHEREGKSADGARRRTEARR